MLLLTKPKKILRSVMEPKETIRGEVDISFIEAVRKRTSLISDDNAAMSIIYGAVAWRTRGKNIIVDTGRRDLLRRITGVSGASSYLYGGVGDDGSSPTSAALTALENELVAGTNRIAITDSGGGALDDTDIVADVVGSNRLKYTIAFEHGLSDPNNGRNFEEWGVFDTLACPGMEGGTNGKMFCRYGSSGFAKDNSFVSRVVWIWRS